MIYVIYMYMYMYIHIHIHELCVYICWLPFRWCHQAAKRHAQSKGQAVTFLNLIIRLLVSVNLIVILLDSC